MQAKEKFLTQLGARIAKLREERGISQSELAHAIGKDQQSIQRIEKGRINPSAFYLHELAQGLNVDMSDFFD
jgi:transcriptional regulator with XRE-family HTH domain